MPNSPEITRQGVETGIGKKEITQGEIVRKLVKKTSRTMSVEFEKRFAFKMKVGGHGKAEYDSKNDLDTLLERIIKVFRSAEAADLSTWADDETAKNFTLTLDGTLDVSRKRIIDAYNRNPSETEAVEKFNQICEWSKGHAEKFLTELQAEANKHSKADKKDPVSPEAEFEVIIEPPFEHTDVQNQADIIGNTPTNELKPVDPIDNPETYARQRGLGLHTAGKVDQLVSAALIGEETVLREALVDLIEYISRLEKDVYGPMEASSISSRANESQVAALQAELLAVEEKYQAVDREWQARLAFLDATKARNAELETQNRGLREYIDKLREDSRQMAEKIELLKRELIIVRRHLTVTPDELRNLRAEARDDRNKGPETDSHLEKQANNFMKSLEEEILELHAAIEDSNAHRSKIADQIKSEPKTERQKILNEQLSRIDGQILSNEDRIDTLNKILASIKPITRDHQTQHRSEEWEDKY